MALSKSSNRRMKRHKALQNIVVFISANISGAGGTSCKAQNHPESQQGIGGPTTNIFELQLQKHGGVCSTCEFRRNYACANEMHR